jgi:hypothetical protein
MRVIYTKCGSVQDDTMLGRNCLYCCNISISEEEDNAIRGRFMDTGAEITETDNLDFVESNWEE